MNRTLCLTSADETAAKVRSASGNAVLVLPATPFPGDLGQLQVALRGAAAPEICILDPDPGDLGAALALASALDRQLGSVVILVTGEAGSVALEALRAGIRDVLEASATALEIRAALDRAAAAFAFRHPAPGPAATQPERARGRVITVASPKGGVGKTTVATNVAVGIARQAPQATVLIDLDLHFGDVASALNLNPEYTLPDTVKGPASHDAMALKGYLTLHRTGLHVIAGSHSPAAADGVSAAEVTRLIDMLAGQFTTVVIDTAPGLSEHTLAALDQSDQVVLVTSLDVPGVRGLRKELDTLDELGLLVGARSVVLNFNEPARGLTIADVQATIGCSVDVVLPQSSVVPMSVNQGIPLLQSDGRDPVTKKLRSLVELVASPGPAPEPKRGLFGRSRGGH